MHKGLPTSLPSDAEIRRILADRVDVQKRSVGIVVGIVTPQGQRLVCYGRQSKDDSSGTPPVDGNTLFEIGSLTKVFTSLLLADMAERGEVRLSSPVTEYLPAGARVPVTENVPISLLDLATHSSGLSAFPQDFPASGPPDAQAAYTFEQLHRSLSAVTLADKSGSKWSYSNTGYSLLGEALAHRAGVDFPSLLRKRLLALLGLHSTGFSMTQEMRSRFHPGYDSRLQPAPEFQPPVFLAAGGLRSSANDLMTFLSCMLRPEKTPFTRAIKTIEQTRRPGPNFVQAMGWTVYTFGPEGGELLSENGGTPGFSAQMALDRKGGVGVVVLSNSADNIGDIVWHLLRPAYPLRNPAAMKPHKEIRLEVSQLADYAGSYRTADGSLYRVIQEGNALYLQTPNLPRLRIRPESERSFFNYDIDIIVTFDGAPQKDGSVMTIRIAGRETQASRVSP